MYTAETIKVSQQTIEVLNALKATATACNLLISAHENIFGRAYSCDRVSAAFNDVDKIANELLIMSISDNMSVPDSNAI